MSNIQFGEIPGIKEGQKFGSRRALMEAGLHRSIQSGIDGNGNEGTAAIVVSGGYEDDEDWGDEIIYTGHGGNDTTSKKQIDHQSWDSSGNKGLLISEKNNLPVRVIRGPHQKSKFAPKSGFVYSGLFKVVDSSDKIGKSGFKVCLFTLKKIKDSDKETGLIKEGTLTLLSAPNLENQWYGIGCKPPKGGRKLKVESIFAQKLLNKNVGDIVDFGPGFEILDIKKFMSK